MATFSTQTSNFSDLVQELVSARLEEELRASLPHTSPGNYVPGRIIKGTNIIRYARYPDLAAQTTALSEGTPPISQSLSIQSETLSVQQYGGVLEWTDLAEIDSPHDVVAINAERAARQAAVTIDTIVRDVLAAGTNVKYSNGSARSAVSATLTGAKVKQMFWYLRDQNVPTFGDGTYRAIITPEQAFDLESDTATGGWMDVHKYVDNSPLLSGEIGRYAGVRFMVSSSAKVFATAGASNADVHSGFFMGTDSYVIGDSQSLAAYFVPRGGDHSDPIAQKAMVGWKVRFGSILLDQAGARYVRLETAASTL
jgi:N4-gp56 family major capsid protein